MSRPDRTDWSDLLDRVEARTHHLQAALAGQIPQARSGSDPTLEKIPMMPPTPLERVRLDIVLAAHRAAEARLRDGQNTAR